ncbi:DUF4263 domain-containing protein [Amycolatopsis sp. WAC 04182]|uniref:Shedu anti-phage system protein SduA domain-containing protein n=1 Tax=Amycolatopsis sp. WAC 04182 TaxID=2203198 RepID=UPI000F7B478D|nr:Shedu anti-phage system protein SduA domain-containing protein [Amycolatopsis sp. WAC 04182]RSN52579.1 DUF4263 domain-containing protein [Amycolatopsis sp. WAC 04182]
MGYRSGFTLVQLLEETHHMTTHAEVLDRIDAAIQFTTSGPDSGGHRYPRGKRLVTYLQDASQAAARLGLTVISDRLADFAEYAAGEIPLSLLETWYFPSRREAGENLMRLQLEAGVRRTLELLAEFIKDRPGASVDEARIWLQKVTKAMELWNIGDDRLGGVKLPKNGADYLTWLNRIQLVLSDPPNRSVVTPEVVEQIAGMAGSDLLARAVQWQKRKAALSRLQAVVEHPDSSERAIHAELKQQTWIFGGRYVKELARRRLTTVDEIDIPLLRGDGSLHVVELKRASVSNLVEPLRSHYAAGPEVHRAVSQAANYLRSLDENRAGILAEHGIDCRRSSATVLIGHAKFLNTAYKPDDVAATLRTYNATLNRIEVVTYQELIEAAKRTMALDEEDAGSTEDQLD